MTSVSSIPVNGFSRRHSRHSPLKNQNKLRNLAATATAILDRYVKYVDNNPVMKAIDEKEFADVAIHAPIKKALADLRKSLS